MSTAPLPPSSPPEKMETAAGRLRTAAWTMTMMMDTQFSRCLHDHDHGDDVDTMINLHTKSSAVSIFCDRVCLTVWGIIIVFMMLLQMVTSISRMGYILYYVHCIIWLTLYIPLLSNSNTKTFAQAEICLCGQDRCNNEDPIPEVEQIQKYKNAKILMQQRSNFWGGTIYHQP